MSEGKVPGTRGVRIVLDPRITPKELHAFYVRNGVCESGFSAKVAGRVLTRSDVIIGAYEGSKLVGLARGFCDGNSGEVAELCVATEYQGKKLKLSNASVIERDDSGLGFLLGSALLREFRRRGAQFVSMYPVIGFEEKFAKSLGFGENPGMKVYVIDARSYVPRSQRIGHFPKSKPRK
jgi:hypothetical protein